MKISECHPEVPHQARGLCRRCYYDANKDAIKRRTGLYQKSEKGKAVAKVCGRNYYIRTFKQKRYGLSNDQVREMVESQKGVCLICGVAPKRLCIDHCHKTGNNRGLLCNNCNVLLGMAKDDLSILKSAIMYLEKASDS